MLIHQASEEKSGNLYEAIALPQVFQSGRIVESAHSRSPEQMLPLHSSNQPYSDSW